MPDEIPTVVEGAPTPQTLNELSAQLQAFLSAQLQELRAEFRAEFREFKEQFEDQQRNLERLALDMKVVREHGRREAGIGSYRRPPVPSDTETDGNGHTTYPWKQRPATPRPG